MASPSADLFTCLRFWSRLPVPIAAGDTAPYASPDFSTAIRMLPIAGLIIALPAGLVLAAARGLWLPSLVAGALVVAALAFTTGFLHEDGLADTADGLLGGLDRARRLEIMRDSRIGAAGASVLGLALIARAAAIASLYEQSLGFALAVVFAGAALSRTAGLFPLALLPPARESGAGHSAQKPDRASLQTAAVIAGIFALLPFVLGAPFGRTLLAALAAAAAAYALVPLARAKIEGQTGDIAGAAQQAAEIAYLCLMSGVVVY